VGSVAEKTICRCSPWKIGNTHLVSARESFAEPSELWCDASRSWSMMVEFGLRLRVGLNFILTFSNRSN
jgi:hypothetical protein